MEYEEKVQEILKRARVVELRGDFDELAALEHSLAVADFYRLSDPREARRILDKAGWGYE